MDRLYITYIYVISSHNGKHHLKWQRKIIRIQSLSLRKKITSTHNHSAGKMPAAISNGDGRTMTAKLTVRNSAHL